MRRSPQVIPDNELLLVGTIGLPHGVRGQLKFHAITSYPEHLRRIKTVYVGDERAPMTITHAAIHKGAVLIMALATIDTREAAETLRGREVFIREADARPLDVDEYYLHDLPDMRVVLLDGVEIGTVQSVIETGANDVLVVRRTNGGEALIPMIKDVVKRLDLGAREIAIDPLPGLLDDAAES
jgi:16S rRNA processing protein RimM